MKTVVATRSNQLTRRATGVRSHGAQAGMTLFEILIVVGIIGDLLAFIIPQVTTSQNRSRVQDSKIRMSNIVQNLTMYQNDCAKFPGALDALVKSDGSCNGWTGPYMKDIPPDGWGKAFIYESDGNTYTLKSTGADKRDGGDGVDKDITQDDIN